MFLRFQKHVTFSKCKVIFENSRNTERVSPTFEIKKSGSNLNKIFFYLFLEHNQYW